MKSDSSKETEVKVRVEGSLAKIRAKLRSIGFSVDKKRVFEENIVLDRVDFELSRSGRALRIRRAGADYTLTYKGPVEGGKHKSREEVETKTDSFENLERIVTRLGYAPVFRYEKYRTEYRKGKTGGVVTLDETPVGVFLEIEGPGPWIDRTALELGFAPSVFITQSYADLYKSCCEEQGLVPGDMIFK